MRAIYIDSERRIIDEVEWPGDLRAMQMIGADALEQVPMYVGRGAVDLILVSECPNHGAGFLMDGNVFYGSGFIVGEAQDGEYKDVATQLLDAAMAIDFLKTR